MSLGIREAFKRDEFIADFKHSLPDIAENTLSGRGTPDESWRHIVRALQTTAAKYVSTKQA